jgi:hypothetical protein
MPAFSIPTAEPSTPAPEPTGVRPPVRPPLPAGVPAAPQAEPPRGAPPVDRAAPFEAVLLVGAQQQAPAPAPPLPLAGGPAAAGQAPAEAGPLVPGIFCTNDHFNDPRIPYCAVCGISMVQATHIPRMGPRPPLGVLVLDDGATFRLDSAYVVGREPERDPEVAQGRARALRIADRGGVVSRVHARIELEGWEVRVVDLGSANGTHLNPQGSTSWTRVSPGAPQPIKPGTRVVFGNRGLRYESHRNP